MLICLNCVAMPGKFDKPSRVQTVFIIGQNGLWLANMELQVAALAVLIQVSVF